MENPREEKIDRVHQAFANAVPSDVDLIDVLRGAIRMAADCIHQMQPDGDKYTNIPLKASLGILEKEFELYQELFGKTKTKSNSKT